MRLTRSCPRSAGCWRLRALAAAPAAAAAGHAGKRSRHLPGRSCRFPRRRRQPRGAAGRGAAPPRGCGSRPARHPGRPAGAGRRRSRPGAERRGFAPAVRRARPDARRGAHPRAVRGPLRSHARRLQARGRADTRAVDEQLRWYALEPRVPAARLRARRSVSLSHRHRARAARHAARAGAAAGGGERLRAVCLLARARLGTVAVHSRHRLALRPEAGLVVRRTARHRRVDARGARLPAVSAR